MSKHAQKRDNVTLVLAIIVGIGLGVLATVLVYTATAPGTIELRRVEPTPKGILTVDQRGHYHA